MKMIKTILLLTFFALIFNLQAYQKSSLNLITPTELGNLEGEFTVSHRFKGQLKDKPLTNFFGLNEGAWVGLFYRQALIHKIELKIGYTVLYREFNLDGSWNFTPDDFPVQAQIDLQYYDYDDIYHPGTRNNNIGVILSGQYVPIKNRILLDANLGYEGQNKRLISGFGLGVIVLPSLTLLGEYYPVFDRNAAPLDVRIQLGKYDSAALGVKLDTYGHQFMFMLTNSQGITLRQITLGTAAKDLKLGFNIQRHFNL